MASGYKFLVQIGPDPLQAPTGVLGPELALWRLVLKNGLWLLSFLWLPPPALWPRCFMAFGKGIQPPGFARFGVGYSG